MFSPWDVEAVRRNLGIGLRNRFGHGPIDTSILLGSVAVQDRSRARRNSFLSPDAGISVPSTRIRATRE